MAKSDEPHILLPGIRFFNPAASSPRIGYLSPIKVKAVSVQIDISNVSSVAGDFHSGRLHDSLTPRLHKIADAIKEHAPGRKILAFLPLIETSRQFAEICNSVGLKAQHVSSQEREKDTLLKHFKSCE